MIGDADSVERLSPDDGAGFAALLGIYRASLPGAEQKREADLRRMARRADYRFLLLRHEGSVAGFAIQFARPGADFALLEYMAVEPSLRSRGLGARLFAACLADARQANPRAKVLIELDDPAEPASDGAQRARRMRFYLRLGCARVASLQYVLPLVGPNGELPPRMVLLAHAPGQVDLLRATLQDWLRTIYVEVYGQGPDDPRLDHMLAGLPDPVPLLR